MLMRGTQILLEAVSLVVHDAQRVGIIGRNGSGKTSLFLALAKAVPLEHGEIKMPTGLRLSMMDQETPGSENLPGICTRCPCRIQKTGGPTGTGRARWR